MVSSGVRPVCTCTDSEGRLSAPLASSRAFDECPQPLAAPPPRSTQGRPPNHLFEIFSRPPFCFSLASSLLTALRSSSEPFLNGKPYSSFVLIACTTTRFLWARSAYFDTGQSLITAST